MRSNSRSRTDQIPEIQNFLARRDAAFQSRIETPQNIIDGFRKEIEKLQGEKTTLLTQIKELHEERERVGKEVKALHDEKEKLIAEKCINRTNMPDLTEEVEALQAEKEKFITEKINPTNLPGVTGSNNRNEPEEEKKKDEGGSISNNLPDSKGEDSSPVPGGKILTTKRKGDESREKEGPSLTDDQLRSIIPKNSHVASSLRDKFSGLKLSSSKSKIDSGDENQDDNDSLQIDPEVIEYLQSVIIGWERRLQESDMILAKSIADERPLFILWLELYYNIFFDFSTRAPRLASWQEVPTVHQHVYGKTIPNTLTVSKIEDSLQEISVILGRVHTQQGISEFNPCKE